MIVIIICTLTFCDQQSSCISDIMSMAGTCGKVGQTRHHHHNDDDNNNDAN